MNASELAQKMLQWEELTMQANALADEIKAAVLALGKTQNVGNVRASYANGRKTYDYETPAKLVASDWAINANSRTVIDWRGVCADESIKPVIVSVGEPSVTVKFVS